MNIRQLKIFVTVCQSGSMTAAAKNLYISQPSISNAIKEFEREYGIQLFDRTSKKLTLTESGKELYSYGTRILSLIDDLTTSINNRKSNTTLRLGTGCAFGEIYLASLIRYFQQNNDQCNFQIIVDSSEVLEPALTNGELDFCIMEGTSHIPDFHHHEVYRSPIVAVCHQNHPFAAQKNVTAKMLAGESLLLREKMCPTREMTDAYFSNHNLSVTPFFESSSPLTLLNAVKENFGIAILPLDHYEYFYSSELKLINIPDFHYTRYIDFIYKKKTILSPLAQTLMQFVIQYIPLIQKTFCAKNKNTL